MRVDQLQPSRKRGILLALFGGLLGDGSLVLLLRGGPWQWLLTAALGYSLAAIAVARIFRKRRPASAIPTL